MSDISVFGDFVFIKYLKIDFLIFLLHISIINRREVEVDMEKCKKRNTEHCTKSKFCAKRYRGKILELCSKSLLANSALSSL